MGIGQDYQSQRFLSLGPMSQSSKTRNCPNDFCPSPKSPRDLCPMERLWDIQNSLDCLGLEIPTCSKAWDSAVPEIFVPGLSQFQASQKISPNPSPKSWDFCPMRSQSHFPSLSLRVSCGSKSFSKLLLSYSNYSKL